MQPAGAAQGSAPTSATAQCALARAFQFGIGTWCDGPGSKHCHRPCHATARSRSGHFTEGVLAHPCLATLSALYMAVSAPTLDAAVAAVTPALGD